MVDKMKTEIIIALILVCIGVIVNLVCLLLGLFLPIVNIFHFSALVLLIICLLRQGRQSIMTSVAVILLYISIILAGLIFIYAPIFGIGEAMSQGLK